jgi:hypothetical protein
MSAMVDIDLLADYVGGALVGTPQQQQVQDLISTDPAWRQAAQELALALDAVAEDLRTTARTAEPMPADLVNRFDELLAGPTFATKPAQRAKPAIGERVVPRGGGIRRRLMRWGAPIAVAAGIAAVIGGGLLTGGPAGENPAADSAAELYSSQAAVPKSASGADLTREQVGNSAASKSHGLSAETDRSATQPAPNDLASAVPAELSGLLADARLARCLASVDQQIPGAVLRVDFARFESTPALIILIRSGEHEWVFVAGADCGIVDSDELYRAQVR